ncbi:MAG TPA: Cna B-type domain-containing protein [Candidatus Anaerobutyricum faecale]|nr:Cna B-type domain-containing protein [Candidatus Anaerobutyricum faecale]
MSQNPVIHIHLLGIRSYRGFTSLESSLQTCFAITYNKKFEGIGETDRQQVEEQLQFQITAKDNNTGEDLTSEKIIELFGKGYVTGKDSDVIQNADGSLTWNIAYRTIDNNASYTVTLVEQNAGLSGYNVTTQADNRVVTGAGETVGEGATFALTSGTTAYVNFTNTYERNENKTVNFTKVWDDGAYGATTRPDSLDVTLKPTITVYEDNEWKTKELTSEALGGIELTKTITSEQEWKTSWDVPVYYDGEEANGVKVKIDYTVVEDEVGGNYVYKATSNEALPGDGSDYTSQFNPSGDTITSAQSAPSQKSSNAAAVAMAAAASTKAAKGTDSTASDDLGEPAHNKYIEYNDSTNDYTLNLDVTGAKGEAKGVDVLFVIDTSGSMAGNSWWGTGGLLSSTQNLLTEEDNGIIDQIFKAEGNVNSVAYVSFAGKSETKVSGWYNENNSDALKDSINGLRATGGTNWTYAMQRASDVLEQRANNDNEKVVIFLSDGEPTYTMSGNRQTGSGSSTRDYYYKDAANVVQNSTSLSGAKIYSVYLTSSTETGMNYFAELLQDRDIDAESKNGTNLETALNDILDIIIPTYKNVTITDTLSDYVDFVNSDDITVTKRAADGTETGLVKNTDYTVDISGKKVTVTLNGNGEGALDDGATYTVSFKVKPNETAENHYAESGYPHKGDPGTGATSAGQKGFHSNNDATVTYTVNEKEDTADYPDPVVQVTTHNLTIEKKWNHPAGVEEPDSDVGVIVTFTDGTRKNITLTKDKGYKETLTNEPVTRKIATVEETSMFNNYEPSYQYSADRTTATVINNYSKLTTQKIVVNKEWEGNGPKSDVQIVLYRSVNGGDAEEFETATLTEDNKWTVEWKNLKLKEEDTAAGVNNTYTYAVREVNIPVGYSSSISYDYNSTANTTTATITNTYDSNCADENYYIANVLQTEKLNVSKTWEDNDNAAGLRPNSVSVSIDDNSGGYYDVTLDEGNSWHKTLTVLKKKNRTYTATETMNGANTDKYTMGNEGNAIVNGTNLSFTNTLNSTSITVQKEWEDNDVADRPTGIEFKLEYSDDEGKTWHPYGEGEVWEDAEGGTEEGDSATPVPGTYILLKENIIYDKDGNATEWARTFTNLPIQYEYRVKEVNVPGQYYSEVTTETSGKGTTFTITNTLKWSLKKTNSPENGEEAVVLQGANFELKQGNTVIATGISGQDGVVAWDVKTDNTTGKPYDLQNLNGDYVLTETKAPTGYQGLTTITWKLHFDDDGVLTSAASYKGNDLLVDGDNENEKDPYITLTSSSETGVVITVQNDLLYELPETGGSGTYWYTVSGALLMMGAALIVYREKRKREVLLRK